MVLPVFKTAWGMGCTRSWWVRFPHAPAIPSSHQAAVARTSANLRLFQRLLSIEPSSIIPSACGAVAQLGARLNGIEKVRGSNPRSSIFFSPLFAS